eukprot:1082339-Amphidinium_carterae.1
MKFDEEQLQLVAPLLLKLGSKVLKCLDAKCADADRIIKTYPLLRAAGNRTWPPQLGWTGK